MLDVERVRGAVRGAIGRRVECFDSVASTMDVVRERAAAGGPHGLVVIAEEQTAGRGRMGRAWVSPPGLNLYFTVLLRVDVPTLRRLPYVVPLAVALALEDAGLQPAIKWPNDVQLGGRKACGVLIDSYFEGGHPAAVLAGIGLNVNLRASEHPEIASIATSMLETAGRAFEREEVLASVLNRLDAALGMEPGRALAEWRARLATLGQPVRLRMGDQVVEGTAVDVEDDGSLVLQLPDGSRRSFAAGEVTTRA